MRANARNANNWELCAYSDVIKLGIIMGNE